MKEIEQLKINLDESRIVNFLENYKNFLKNFTKTVVEDIEEEGGKESDLISRLEITSNIEIYEDSQYRSEITTGLERLAVELTKLKISHVDYSRISQLVIDLKSDSKDDDESDISSLSDYIEASKLSLGDLINKFEQKQNKEDCPFSAESLTVLHKIIEHTSLINIQYSSLYENQEQELKELDKRIETAKEELSNITNNYNEKSKKFEEKFENLNVEIISVLGIFASIIFAVFGGVSQLGALGGKLATTSVSKIFIFVGASSFVLFSVVFMAFAATARLTGRELKACSCAENRNTECKIRDKYPIYFISIVISIVILILGVLGNRGVDSVILKLVQSIFNI